MSLHDKLIMPQSVFFRKFSHAHPLKLNGIIDPVSSLPESSQTVEGGSGLFVILHLNKVQTKCRWYM